MSYKDYLIFALSVLALILLILMSSAGQDFWRSLPKFGDLATSPATRELVKSNPPAENVAEDGAAPENGAAENETARNESFAEDLPSGKEFAGGQDRETVPVSVPIAPSTAPDSPRSDIVIIPSINVNAPIVTTNTDDAVKLKKLLDDGAVIYPSSPGFGKTGQTILMGHSAPPNWPEIKHDTIFSRLAELGQDDKIIVVYDDKTYTYSFSNSEIIPKGGEIPPTSADSALVLVSCWPPGRDLQRIIVQAKLDSVN